MSFPSLAGVGRVVRFALQDLDRRVGSNAADIVTLETATAIKDYTPVLTVLSGTDPTLGTGAVIIGKYCVVGGMCSVWVRIKWGTSGAAAGSGAYRMSLPFPSVGITTSNSANNGQIIGVWQGMDQSGSTGQRGRVQLASPSDEVMFLYLAANTVADNAPWVWTNIDRITMQVSYPIAGVS